MPPTQGVLPFKKKSRGQRVRVLEKDIERQVDFDLNRRGFWFLNTTVRYPYFEVTCPNPKCGRIFKARNNRGTGQDKGIPDRLLYSRSWWHPLLKASLWLGIELKGSHTPYSSKEQEHLHKSGHTVLARDGQTALEAAQAVDEFFNHVEGLENDAAALLVGLRTKDPNWRDLARALEARLRFGAGPNPEKGDV